MTALELKRSSEWLAASPESTVLQRVGISELNGKSRIYPSNRLRPGCAGAGGGAEELLHADADPFAVDQFVEDGQDFLTKIIDPFHAFAEVAVVERVTQPAVEDFPGNFDVAPQLIGVVAAQK